MIPIIFAQLPAPSPTEWWQFSVGGVALLGIIALARSLMRRPPLEAEFASKVEVAMLRSEINERLTGLSAKVTMLRTEIVEERREDKKDAESRVNGLHSRLDELRGDIVAIRDAQVADMKALLNSFRTHGGASR